MQSFFHYTGQSRSASLRAVMLPTVATSRRLWAFLGVLFLAIGASRATEVFFFTEPAMAFWSGPLSSRAVIDGRAMAPEQYRLVPHLLAVLLTGALGTSV